MKRAGVAGGRLMLELSDGSNISVDCLGEPYASQIAADIMALRNDNERWIKNEALQMNRAIEAHAKAEQLKAYLTEIERLTGETTMSTWDTWEGGSRKKINEIATTALKHHEI